jgi:hypothetical protein
LKALVLSVSTGMFVGIAALSAQETGRPQYQARDRARGDNDGDRRGDPGWDRGRGRDAQNVLHWRGSVDDGLEIRVQGTRITYRNLSGKGFRNVRAELPRFGIPRDNVQLRLREFQGRGDVYVVQQPTRRNGFTAVIRIYDPRPSFGYYDFDVAWRDAHDFGR